MEIPELHAVQQRWPFLSFVRTIFVFLAKIQSQFSSDECLLSLRCKWTAGSCPPGYIRLRLGLLLGSPGMTSLSEEVAMGYMATQLSYVCFSGSSLSDLCLRWFRVCVTSSLCPTRMMAVKMRTLVHARAFSVHVNVEASPSFCVCCSLQSHNVIPQFFMLMLWSSVDVVGQEFHFCGCRIDPSDRFLCLDGLLRLCCGSHSQSMLYLPQPGKQP